MGIEREFFVYAVKIHEKIGWPVIILKDQLNEKSIAIVINKSNAFSTLIALKPDTFPPVPRPLSQDLFLALASAAGLKIQKVVIDHLTEEGIFTAKIEVSRGETKDFIKLDARPSDAIALAVQAKTPIWVSPEVISGTSPISPDEPPYREATSEDFSGP
jgi:hypothetical protein